MVIVGSASGGPLLSLISGPSGLVDVLDSFSQRLSIPWLGSVICRVAEGSRHAEVRSINIVSGQSLSLQDLSKYKIKEHAVDRGRKRIAHM